MPTPAASVCADLADLERRWAEPVDRGVVLAVRPCKVHVHGALRIPARAHHPAGYVVAIEAGHLLVLDTAGEQVAQVVGHGGRPANTIARLPDAEDGSFRCVTGGDDGNLVVWSARTWTPERALLGHTQFVREVAVAGNVVVSGAEDRTVRLWDLTGERPPHVFEGHRSALRGVAVSADGRFAASASRDNTVFLWDLVERRLHAVLCDAGGVVRDLPEMPGIYVASRNRSGVGHVDAPRSLCFSVDGARLFTGGREVIAWDLATLSEVWRAPGSWETEALVALPDGRSVVAAARGQRLLDVATGEVRRVHTHHAGERTTALSFDGDRWTSGSAVGHVSTWSADVAAPEPPHAGAVNLALLAAGAERAVTRDLNGTVLLWSVADGRRVARLDDVREPNGRPLALSPDGSRLAMLLDTGGLLLVDTANGERLRTFDLGIPDHERPTLVFHDDGQRILVVRDAAFVLDLATGERLPIAEKLGFCYAALFTRDVAVVAWSRGDLGALGCFDARTGACRWQAAGARLKEGWRRPVYPFVARVGGPDGRPCVLSGDASEVFNRTWALRDLWTGEVLARGDLGGYPGQPRQARDGALFLHVSTGEDRTDVLWYHPRTATFTTAFSAPSAHNTWVAPDAACALWRGKNDEGAADVTFGDATIRARARISVGYALDVDCDGRVAVITTEGGEVAFVRLDRPTP